MPSQPPIAPNTKAGLSSNATKTAGTAIEYPSKEDLAAFFDGVHAAKAQAMLTRTVAAMETPRKMIEHFLRAQIAGFEKTYYFIYDNVKVFEEGKREEGERIENLSSEERMHGGKT